MNLRTLTASATLSIVALTGVGLVGTAGAADSPKHPKAATVGAKDCTKAAARVSAAQALLATLDARIASLNTRIQNATDQGHDNQAAALGRALDHAQQHRDRLSERINRIKSRCNV